MACYYPLDAWRDGDDVVFSDPVKGRSKRTSPDLSLPCGQCFGCRLERSRQMALRCMHEASMHDDNCVITLTYDEAHLPRDGGLHYEDFQRFLKRLRKFIAPRRVRFFVGGEYGENFGRPHFHACLFGYAFSDLTYWARTAAGSRLYRSAVLERLWPFGFSSVGELTFESAAYIARYCMAKRTGPMSADHYRVVDSVTGEIFDLSPEFGHMSLKPGIGATWLEKYQADVYPNDYVIVRGVKCRPPRYYDKLVDAKLYMDDVEFERENRARRSAPDNVPERLVVREQVARARMSSHVRKLT